MGTIHAGGRCRIMANVSARGNSDNISALYFADVDFMCDGVTFEMGSTKLWRGITSSSDGTKLAAVVWDGNHGNTVSEGNIWTSTDSGANWTEVNSTGIMKKWFGITSSSDGVKLAAVVWDGNIWTSTDSGATWTEDTSVLGSKQWRGITSSSDGTNLASVVHGGNIWTFSAPSPPPPPPRPCTCCERSMKSFGFSVGAEDCDPEL